MSKIENPPAFPHEYWFEPKCGMSLRDWFAGQVVAAIVSALTSTQGENHYLETTDFSMEAADAYQAADAMLAERQKGQIS